MHHEDIKATIRKKGVTLQQVAAHLGVKGTTLSQVIRGTVKSARLAEAIAQLCEQPVSRLWPGLYDEPRSPSPPAVLSRLAQQRAPMPKAKTEKAASAPVAAAGEPAHVATERREAERRERERRQGERRQASHRER